MKLPLPHCVAAMLLLSSLQPALAQSKKKTTRSTIAKTQTATPINLPAVVEISEREKEIISEINLARSNPRQYVQKLELFRSYYKGKDIHFPDGLTLETSEGAAAVDEAIAFLKTAKPLPPFELREGMVRGARDHLTDLGTTGKTGHLGSDGSFPKDRLSRYGAWSDLVGEDIVYHNRNARDSVIGLIIDDGVANRGHRLNIFKPTFRVIGVAMGEPRGSRSMCVITFAGTFDDKTPSQKKQTQQSTPTATKY